MLIQRSAALFLIVFVFSLPSKILAQSCLPSSNGQQIGLVLSGGGARGTAHVGVIKVLEKLKIPIHCVVGTSMGAVVGALHASGLVASEIQSIVETIDWNRGFVDEFPREKLPLNRKDEVDEFLIKFELGLRERTLNLPRGVIQGHGLHLLLKELMQGASLVHDFNKLPIPFQAVTTDIVSAETVSLSSGDLARAVQASMSIPGIFAPVEIDNRLLVDGGVTQNLPVSRVREMGADIVIAIDIGTPLSKRENLSSVVAIVDQVTNVLTLENVSPEIAKLGDQDVFIQPDLTGYATMDFAKAAAIVEAGRLAAEQKSASLLQLAVADADYLQYRQQLSKIPTLPEQIGSVTLSQNSKFNTPLLVSKLSEAMDDNPFDIKEFHSGLNSLYSSGLFERVTYRYVDGEPNVGVAVSAEEKTWGPDLIRFGFSLEDDFGGNNNFNISAGYRRKAINSYGGDVRVVGQIGETPRFLAEFFQPLGALSEYYSQVQFEHEQYSQGQFSGTAQTGEFRTRRFQFGLYAGRLFGHHSDARAGFKFAKGRVQRSVGDVSLDERQDFDEGSFTFRYRYDTLDSNQFPTSGGRLQISYESAVDELGANEEYSSVSIDALTAKTLHKNRLVIALTFQSATYRELPAQKQFSQGGLLNTSGLSQDVKVGQHATRLTAVAFRPFNSEQIAALDFPIYYGLALGAGEVYQSRDQINLDSLQYSGSLFFAADTPAGPAFLGVGAAEGDGLSLLLSLGLSF